MADAGGNALMFDWAIGGLDSLFGFVGEAAGETIGWAWDKVIQGIYTWLANGLALLIEWVWSVLDSSSTPRVTQDWFQNALAGRLAAIGLAVTVAMMLASAIQAALAGRPEQIGDATKEGVRAIVGAALTITVLDVLIGVVDEASALVWQVGRDDLVTTIEGMVTVATTTGPLGSTFVGPLCLLFGFLGLIGLVVSLMMRTALIYVIAAIAPIVWSTNVLPLFRGSVRKLVHLAVALVVSKLAIVVALVVAVKLIANPSGDPASGSVVNDGAAAVGQLMSGFVCFMVAAVTPLVLYKLMPTVEGAVVGAGIAGGWGRSAVSGAHTAMMVKSFGASAATRSVAGQGGVAGVATSGTSTASAQSTSPPAVTGLSSRGPATSTAPTARPSRRRDPGAGGPGPGTETRPRRGHRSQAALAPTDDDHDEGQGA